VARYEIRSAQSGEVLSKHRTRQGALDRWRMAHAGIQVAIWRTYADRTDRLVVEGTWQAVDADD
jgi:hypothetical protein